MKKLLADNSQIRRFFRGVVVGLVTAACGLALLFTPWGATFERTFGLDWLFKIRGARVPPNNVVVVNISNQTGPALGLPRSPHHWPRTIHARLVNKLIDQKAEGIVFAIDFSRAREGPQDAILGDAFSEADRVVLFEGLKARRQSLINMPGGGGIFAWFEERRPPTAALAMAAKGFGPFPLPKLDESALEFWAFKPSAGNAPTSAAVALQLKGLALYDEWLAVLKKARLPEQVDLPRNVEEFEGPSDMRQLMLELRKVFREDGLFQKRVMKALEHVDDRARPLLESLASLYGGPHYYHLNFFGPPGTVRTISYETFLREDVKQLGASDIDLAGHMVFVGYSDLYDPDQPGFHTSFTSEHGVDLSGVEIMATAYANLLNQRSIKPSSATTSASAVLFFGLVVGILAYLLPATAAVPAVLAFAFGYAAFVQWRFDTADLWMPLSTPILAELPLALFLGLMGQYLIERRKEKLTRQTFGRYLSDEVVKTLLESPSGSQVGGNKRLITMLMADLRGFTPVAERLPLERVHFLLNRYLTKVVRIAKDHSGTIDEIIGDAVFVLFGAPNQKQDDAERAVACAVDMQLAIASINEQNLKDALPELEMGIGIHTGETLVGNIGSPERLKYGVVGSNVNLTSRIQSFAVGGQILISDMTRQHVGSLLKLGEHMEISAKGLENPVSVYEVLGVGGRHGRYLPRSEDELVTLREEIRIRCEIFESNRLSGLFCEGALTKIAPKTAEIALERSIPELSNIKLQVLNSDGEVIHGTIYAKVLPITPSEEGHLLIHFTSATPDAEAFVRGLIETNISDEKLHRSKAAG